MLNRDFRDMLSCFAKHDVEYLMIGAYALAAHGIPRATGDMDLWVGTEVGNLRRVLLALADFGAPVGDLSAEQWAQGDDIVQIGVEPSRIDVLTMIDGLSFAEAWPHRVPVTVDGDVVWVIAKDDLICNKTATGRDKDRLDVAMLRALDTQRR